MSEKDWHAVARMNSLLNAHRFVFTQPESDEKTKKDKGGKGEHLKFRRIEKAPYSGKQLALSVSDNQHLGD